MPVENDGQPIASDVNTAPESSSDAQKISDVNTGDSSVTQDDKQQSSSSEGQGDKKVSLQDQIAKAIDDVQKKPAVSPADKQNTSKPNEPKDTDKKNQDDEDDKNTPVEVREHPAFKKVLRERKAARDDHAKVSKELDAFKSDAAQYRQIDTFLKTNNISYKDASDALKLAALAYKDPAAFAVEIQKLAKQWGSYVGEILPDDLQKEVDEGLITEGRAKELAKARGQVAITQNQLQIRDQRISVSDSEKELSVRQQLMENWIDQVAKTDSAIEKKLPLITGRMSQIRALEGDPKDVNEVWQRLNRAYKEVNEHLKPFQPPRNATPPVPQPTGVPRGATPAPTTFEGALEAALANFGTART